MTEETEEVGVVDGRLDGKLAGAALAGCGDVRPLAIVLLDVPGDVAGVSSNCSSTPLGRTALLFAFGECTVLELWLCEADAAASFAIASSCSLSLSASYPVARDRPREDPE